MGLCTSCHIFLHHQRTDLSRSLHLPHLWGGEKIR
jgi:hypothetical protein